MPIWDTVVRSGADSAQLARATHLFVGNEGPFYTGHLRPYEPSSFTDPRLVASMLGTRKKDMGNYLRTPGIVSGPIRRHTLGESGTAIMGTALGVGVIGGVINASIGGLLVYAVARMVGANPPRARNAAYWGAGIIGIGTLAITGVAGVAAVSTDDALKQQELYSAERGIIA